ncbi:hypothetical protein Ahy_A10g049155 isoform C [Arachis hypogaea]|uniref:Uncharacterized protein n=1 Tax=Arachis hypogaea TaxID=3818 RepID=A0A445B6R3_ARAHY|nr:hypothetical protein Ahy_A10g049155 isoform C [Arachis hypogaea]
MSKDDSGGAIKEDSIKAIVESQFENNRLECVGQQVEQIENIEPSHHHYDEPPSYYEPFPQNDESFHPHQPPMDDILGVLVQGQEVMKRDVQNFMAALDAGSSLRVCPGMFFQVDVPAPWRLARAARVSFMVDCGGALVSDLSQTNAWTAFRIKIMNNLNP